MDLNINVRVINILEDYAKNKNLCNLRLDHDFLTRPWKGGAIREMVYKLESIKIKTPSSSNVIKKGKNLTHRVGKYIGNTYMW